MNELSIYDFIDSPELSKYNRDLNTKWYPFEQAIIIAKSEKRTVEEKISLLEDLVSNISIDDWELKDPRSNFDIKETQLSAVKEYINVLKNNKHLDRYQLGEFCSYNEIDNIADNFVYIPNPYKKFDLLKYISYDKEYYGILRHDSYDKSMYDIEYKVNEETAMFTVDNYYFDEDNINGCHFGHDHIPYNHIIGIVEDTDEIHGRDRNILLLQKLSYSTFNNPRISTFTDILYIFQTYGDDAYKHFL